MGQTAAGTEHGQSDAQGAVGQRHGLLDNADTLAPPGDDGRMLT